MSGNRGLNGNQNHTCRGISTKVLQPPGGASNISFSDGSQYHTNKSSRPPMQRRKEPEPQQDYRQQSYNGNNERRPRSNSDDVGADTLDSAIAGRRGDSIPGLESHYSGRKGSFSSYDSESSYSSNSGVCSGRNGPQAKMSSQDYAAALKAQISAKRVLGGADTNSYSNSCRDQQRRNSRDSYDNGYGGNNSNSYNIMNNIGANGSVNQTPMNYASCGRGQSMSKMSSSDYAAALKAQIDSRQTNDGITANVGARASQRGDGCGGRKSNNTNNNGYDSDYKENSFPGSGGGAGSMHTSTRCSNPPGGKSSFQLF